MNGNRVIWVLAVVAVGALVAGLGLGRFIVSPGQAAANADAPTAGLITVPIESRELANDVTIRGDAAFADSVDIAIEIGEISGAPVVTGQVPAVDAILNAGSIALEIAGRPVIVLPGELPVYRTLRSGVSGPDVLQLKQSLSGLGIDAGPLESDVFDSSTAAAVDALYARVGYPSPAASVDALSAVSAARTDVASATESVELAAAALAIAQRGPSDVDRVEQDNLVRSAQRALEAAKTAGDALALADADDAVALAIARRDATLAPGDSSEEEAAVESANTQLARANELLAEAENDAATTLPASEIVYLPGLPRRVDDVSVKRGSTITSTVMTVSGATLVISASASKADAELITNGAPAILTLPDGDHNATVASVSPAAAGTETEDKVGSAELFTVLLTPEELTADQIRAIQGSNLRVRIPVNSTDGEVLAVPLAALTAGPGGESRIELSSGTGTTTTLVEVTTGLAADGFVEVTAVTGALSAGDLVVVGR